MTLRNWLNITNALLIGCVLGWFLRTHSVNDRWMMAKVDKYEAEAHYWITKLDNEIQEYKGDIDKEKNNAKR